MTISSEGNHLKSCNNNQPLHHEKTAPRPPRPPTAILWKTDLPLKKGILQEEMMGVAQFWELVLHLYFFLWSAPTHHPTQPFRFSVCLDTRSVFLAQKSFFGSGSFLTMRFGKDCYWAFQAHSRKGPNYSSGWRFSVAVVLVCFSSAPNQNMAPRASLFGHFQSGPRERFW